MSRVFEWLQELDATPDQALIEAYNQHFGSEDSRYRLISGSKVRPCFFSGDIEVPGKVVTVSLNPAYSRKETEAEQANAGKHFKDWYEFCRFRFQKYDSDAKMHLVFKNLFKVIAPPEAGDRRSFLQNNLLNLDWCYYYSEIFPSFEVDTLPPNLQQGIKAWDTNLIKLMEVAKPRYVFIHGKSMRAWVNRTTANLNPVLELENSRHQPCRLFKGKLNGTSTSVYYLEHFINVVNQKATLERINQLVNKNL